MISGDEASRITRTESAPLLVVDVYFVPDRSRSSRRVYITFILLYSGRPGGSWVVTSKPY